jgi:diguanylate cyclase (GGDEF)-like protein/PAS domain S-box-containing protein
VLSRSPALQRMAAPWGVALATALMAAVALALAPAAHAEDAGQFRFRRLGAAEGLAQSSVYALRQDHHGFLWLGTQDGLHRYDGYGFAIARPEAFAAGTLPHGLVQSLLEDHAGQLWVGTYKGLAATADGGRRFSRPLGERPLVVAALLEDTARNVWVATLGDGLFRLGADRKELQQFRRGLAHTLPADNVYSLVEDAEGDLWAGIDGALLRRRPQAADFEIAWQPEGGGAVRALAFDGAGRLWAGIEGGGLALFEPGRLAPRIFRHQPGDSATLASNDVSALLVDHRQRLWVGTQASGLDLLASPERGFVHFRHDPADADSLSHDGIRSLTEDQSGLVWVGTALGGVTLVNSHSRFEVVRRAPGAPGGLPADSVRAFLEDAQGGLWIATDGGGVVRRDPATGEHRPLLDLPVQPERRIWSLFADPAGRVWIGGQNGLHVLEPAPDGHLGPPRTLPSVTTSRVGVGPGSVRAMVQDEAGRLWIGHFGGGLSRLSDASGENVEHFRHRPDTPFSLPSDAVLALFRDQRDHLWVGTAEGLARRTADGRFHVYRHDPQDRASLIGDVVRAIHQDAAGNLWVGTDGGLNRLAADIVQAAPSSSPGNNRGFQHFTEAEGLPNDTVYAIAEDAQGRLWLSTNRGLARFDPRQGKFVGFGLEDGVQSLEFNGGAAARLRDGRLLFGGVRGYNVVDPERVAANGHVPPIKITGVRVLDRELAHERAIWETDAIELAHDDHVVFVEFAALDFTDPAANRYAYRLVGFDPRWHELGTKHDLSFTNLAAGRYRLEIRGSNDDGVWNETPAVLELRVRPAPWRSWWAWLGYAAVASTVAGLFWRERRRRDALRREIEAVTRTSEQRLNLALLGSGDGLWDWNIATGEIYRSRIAEPLGYGADELPAGHDFRRHLIHPDDQEAVEAAMQANLRGELARFEVEYRVRDKRGDWRWILDRGSIVERGLDGRPLRMAGTFKDMTAHKETESKLRLWATVFKSIDEGVIIIDPVGHIQAVNPALCRMTGWTAEELVGHSMAKLESSELPPETYLALRQALESEGRWQGELPQTRKDGSHLTAWIDFNAVRDEQGRLSHFVAVLSDITRRKESEEELRYLANYDTLTGLPNRSLFQQKLESALQEARHSGNRVALLFGDLDQFKQVNDTLGHAVGDLLLQEASRRLLGSVRRVDTVARLGGDEFTVLLHEVASQEAVVRVADRIMRAFQQPFVLDTQELDISTSLGISLYPDDGGDGQTLLKHADTAMYEAKEKGRSCYCFYTQAMSERAIERLTLENRLRRAVPNDELRVVYQPKFDLEADRIVGVEALLRWQQGEGELLLPGAFVELAEQTGIIVPIGEWVLEAACRQAQAWRAAGLPGLDMAVNVSPHQLAAPGFVAMVRGVLERTAFAAECLVLELTESALMDHAEDNILLLQELKGLGVQLSIDDFGTGYSSLSYLKRLPIDELKIDRSFLQDMTKDDAIVRAILAMAGSLGLRVVAEGVETPEQLEALRRDGCRYVQGFLLGRPQAGHELIDALGGLPKAPARKLRAR